MKKKAAKKSAKKQKLSWHDEGATLLQAIAKKSGSASSIFVLTKNGDLIFQAGKKLTSDLTSVGTLASSVLAASHQLQKHLLLKPSGAQFGEPSKSCWVEPVSDWIVLGVKIKKSAALEKFYKHLKKKQKTQSTAAKRVNTFEALEGLTEAAVDAAFDPRA